MTLQKKSFRVFVWGNNMWNDTHCHLNSEELYPNIDLWIAKAHQNKVETFFVVGWDLPSSQLAVQIAEKYEEVYAIVGIHPCDIDDVDLKQLELLLTHPKVVAVGEIGLDYHWVKEEEKRSKQKAYFIKQIEIANAYHLPISIHSRDAIQDTYDILKEHPPIYGAVMHCFSGSKEMMERFLNLGCMISFGGPVTFKNARATKECAISVPLDRVLLETDSPYLTPHPHRGEQNDPSFIPFIATEVASLKGIPEQELSQAILQNTKRFFRL